MTSIEDLKKKLQSEFENHSRQLSERRHVLQEEMKVEEVRQDKFYTLVPAWIQEAVLPRLQTLVETFPNSEKPDVNKITSTIKTHFQPSEQFPTGATVTISFALNPSTNRVHVRFGVDIIPILMDYERERCMEINMENSDRQGLEVFIDESIVQFAKDYLRVGAARSPYQQYSLVRDLVCGMQFSKIESATSFEYGTRKYYFCSPACCEKFKANPEGYFQKY